MASDTARFYSVRVPMEYTEEIAEEAQRSGQTPSQLMFDLVMEALEVRREKLHKTGLRSYHLDLSDELLTAAAKVLGTASALDTIHAALSLAAEQPRPRARSRSKANLASGAVSA